MPAALFQGLFGGGEDIFGTKPVVPDFTPISTKEAQKQAISENIANFGKTKKLAGSVNKFNQDQLLKMLRAGVPNYDAIVKAGGDSALSLLTDQNIAAFRRGEIPADVGRAIGQSGAEQAVGRGFAYSGGGPDLGMKDALVGRDLGLESTALIKYSFDATQNALSSTEKWLSNVATLTTPGLFNVSSMFFTPQQQYSMMANERDSKMARDWLASQVLHAPNPADRGQFDAEMSILSSYLGTSYGGWNKPSYTSPTGQSGGGGGSSSVDSFYNSGSSSGDFNGFNMGSSGASAGAGAGAGASSGASSGLSFGGGEAGF